MQDFFEIQNFVNKLFYLPKSLPDKNLIIQQTTDKSIVDRQTTSIKALFDRYCDTSTSFKLERLSAYFVDKDEDFPNKATSLVSSSHGKIEKILMTLPTYNGDKHNEYPIFIYTLLDLLYNLKDTHFYIFTAININKKDRNYKKMKDDLNHLLQITGIRKRLHFIIPEQEGATISFWSQDPYLAFKGDRDLFFLMEPIPLFERALTRFIADDIEKGKSPLEIKQIEVKLFFQGGNVLIGDDFVLIGKDDIELTKCYLGINNKNAIPKEEFEKRSNEKVIKLFKSIWHEDKDIIIIGNDYKNDKINENFKEINGIEHQIYYSNGYHQPLVHIDLFITLCGRMESNQPYLILVGELYNITSYESKELDDLYFTPLRNELNQIAKTLSQIKDKNGGFRFKIERIPLPITYMENKDVNQYLWRPISYNNCLIENASSKKVYFPTYYSPKIKMDTSIGQVKNHSLLKIFDAFVKLHWESLGFEAYPLMNYLPLMMKGGAVNCITKCISREYDSNNYDYS